MSGISDFCGLCGSRLGSLLRRDGSVANEADMTEVQNFAQSYLVEPRDQILRPQRRECGEYGRLWVLLCNLAFKIEFSLIFRNHPQ